MALLPTKSDSHKLFHCVHREMCFKAEQDDHEDKFIEPVTWEVPERDYAGSPARTAARQLSGDRDRRPGTIARTIHVGRNEVA
jgi:hypothetical protein